MIKCPKLTDSPVVCSQLAHGGGNVAKTSQTIAASEIVYQAVDVTKLPKKTDDKKKTKTKTKEKTVTVTAQPTSTSKAWAFQTVTAGPLAMMGGALGAGAIALAAL